MRVVSRAKAALALVTCIIVLAAPALAGDIGWTGVAERIEEVLAEATEEYKDGRVPEAMEGVVDAYFGVFEAQDANMEIAVRRFLSVERARRLEKAFTDVRRAMHDDAPYGEVGKMVSDLMDSVNRAAEDLDKKGVGLDSGY